MVKPRSTRSCQRANRQEAEPTARRPWPSLVPYVAVSTQTQVGKDAVVRQRAARRNVHKPPGLTHTHVSTVEPSRPKYGNNSRSPSPEYQTFLVKRHIHQTNCQRQSTHVSAVEPSNARKRETKFLDPLKQHSDTEHECLRRRARKKIMSRKQRGRNERIESKISAPSSRWPAQ